MITWIKWDINKGFPAFSFFFSSCYSLIDMLSHISAVALCVPIIYRPIKNQDLLICHMQLCSSGSETDKDIK